MKIKIAIGVIILFCLILGTIWSISNLQPKNAQASLVDLNQSFNEPKDPSKTEQAHRSTSIIPDQYIIKFKAGKTPAEKEPEDLKNVENEQLTIKEKLDKDTFLVENPQNLLNQKTLAEISDANDQNQLNLQSEIEITEQTIKELQKKPEIEFIEPNTIIKLNYTPNDTFYSSQWHLENTGQNGATAGADIKANQAWDINQGSSSVIIAVIDTGVNISHPDLADKIARKPNNQILGYNFAYNNTNPEDDNGHGTHLAGIIAGTTNNSQGISGVCPNCKIMPIKFMDNTGNGSTAAAINAINYASSNGAKVINLSWGSNSYSASLQNSITNAYNNGVTIVASAGNSNNNDFQFPADMYPVISVVATDKFDKRAYYSNFSNRISVSAPGSDILSTFPAGTNLSGICGDSSFPPNSDGYGYCTGTSMAAPVVAGLAGLVLSHNSGYNPDQIASQIMNTADSIDSLNTGFEGLLGTGRVNAYRALNEVPKPNFQITNKNVSDPNANNNNLVEPGENFNLNLNITNTWANASNVQASLTTTDPELNITLNTSAIGSLNYNQSKNASFDISLDNTATLPKTLNLTLTLSSTGFPYQIINFDYNLKAARTIPAQWNFNQNNQDWETTNLWHLSNSCFSGSTLGSPKYFHFGKEPCGDYNYNFRSNGSLYSPPLKGLSGQQITLSFDQFLETENSPSAYDKATVKIKAYGADDSTATTVISAQNNTAGWQNKTIILPQNLTQSGLFQIFFNFDTIDGTDNAYNGWYIDNIVLSLNDLTNSDITNLNLTCLEAQYNSITTCEFDLPPQKSLPQNFKIQIQNANPSPICTLNPTQSNKVVCANVPTPNSIGIMSIQIVLNAQVISTNFSSKVLGPNLNQASIDLSSGFYGQNTYFFRSQDDLPVILSGYNDLFNTANNKQYTCDFDFGPFGSTNDPNFTSWTNFGSNIEYNYTTGCQSSLTKQLRGNSLNLDIRIRICEVGNSSNCRIFYEQYFFRFEGAGVATGL